MIDVIGFYSDSQQKSTEAVWNKINNSYAQQINPLLMDNRSGTASPVASGQIAPPKPPRTITPETKSPPIKPKKKPVIPPRPSHTLTHSIEEQKIEIVVEPKSTFLLRTAHPF